MWIFACPLLKPVYAYGVMISDIDSRLWKCCVVVIVCIMWHWHQLGSSSNDVILINDAIIHCTSKKSD